MSDDIETTYCDRCEDERADEFVETVELHDEHELCSGCRDHLETELDDVYWYDRYTEEHHDKAVEALRERDEIRCVHGGHYRAGEIIVHTDYVSSAVVKDIVEHFGHQITWFGPRWRPDCIANDMYEDCIQEDGSAFEICLDYNSMSPPPLPLEAPVNFHEIEWLEPDDKQFE